MITELKRVGTVKIESTIFPRRSVLWDEARSSGDLKSPLVTRITSALLQDGLTIEDSNE